MYITIAVQWNIHVQSGSHICSGPYADSLKDMFTIVPHPMVNCSGNTTMK